ncbi:hypothetical protein EDC04DRAFT_167692 [Pisolithus marmoratus]|nr:hypothetical protein EDC04DRAFT_167692 [Pisolithus marmoratus]
MISRVSLLQAFHFYCPYPFSEMVPGLLDVDPSRRPSPTAELLINRKLEPLMKKHGFDARYLPWVNRYPEGLREHIADQSSGCRSEWPSSILAVEFPDNIFDAPDPWVVLGTIALVMWSDSVDEDTDLHDEHWHNFFSCRLCLSLDCFDLPVLPSLSAASVRLCHKLDEDYSEQHSFSRFNHARDESNWVYSHQGGRQLHLSTAVNVAVATFLRRKDVELYGCRRCHAICMESLTDPSSVVGFEVGNSREPDGLGPPLVPNDALREGQYSPSQGSLEADVQEPAGMEAFTGMLRDPTLSRYEKQSRLGRQLLKLRKYVDSLGLNISYPFELHHEHFLDHGTSSSSKLSKSDKVEEIKDKLLEMLSELGLPYERLPWYTLEKDLEKNGYAVMNWPIGVLRKRGNRGIHDLSAVEVNKLYEAITRPDETHRLRICRSQSALTVQPVNRTPAFASSSKHPVPEENDFHGFPSKRIRFKDMTSKVSQPNLTELQDNGAVG